jgi:hypothetical protein
MESDRVQDDCGEDGSEVGVMQYEGEEQSKKDPKSNLLLK